MNNTLSNGFMLLEMLAERGSALSVRELSQATGLPSSHVCRLLKTLVRTGYLEQLPENRKYRVSLKILHLSQARLMHLDLRRLGHPFVAQLGAELKAPVFLSAPCQGRSIIIDVVWAAETESDPALVIGQFHSIRHSACGKVCAAFASPAAHVQVEEMSSAAEEGPPDDDWEQELARIRASHLAIRCEEGLAALAAPVFRAAGLFTGAVGVFFPGRTAPPAQAENVILRTARSISFALGHPVST